MDFLSKIIQIVFTLLVIYLWNKYPVKILIETVVKYHKRNNINITSKQQIKFIVNNEQKIIKYAQYFYWLGGIIICLLILIN